MPPRVRWPNPGYWLSYVCWPPEQWTRQWELCGWQKGQGVNLLYEKEPNLKDDENDRDIITQFAASLGTKVKKGKQFGRYREHKGGQFKYAPIEWFNSDGTIKSEYK